MTRLPYSIAALRRIPQRRNFWSDLKSTISGIVRGDDHINPQKILERRYLFSALLALRYRSLLGKVDDPQAVATEELDDEGVDQMGNMELRRELQAALLPQVQEIFAAFGEVDQQLDVRLSVSGHKDRLYGIDWEPFVNILREDREKIEPETPFLERKLRALDTLLQFHDARELHLSDTETIDDFGVDLSETSEKSLKLLRQYQTINMARSTLLKQKLGYSILCLKSLLSGRGCFIDGSTPPGSIVAFQPGEVWVKEHLMTTAPEVMAHFDGPNDCHISLRFDEHVLDSRRSPIWVLENPWALGHMANHGVPNTQSTMLNYTTAMKVGNSPYIPNNYARPPSWQTVFFDSLDPVDMHSQCLLSTRTVANEEITYDYRLQMDEPPAWYEVVQYEDQDLDEIDQVVFFREDWKKDEQNTNK